MSMTNRFTTNTFCTFNHSSPSLIICSCTHPKFHIQIPIHCFLIIGLRMFLYYHTIIFFFRRGDTILYHCTKCHHH